MNLCYADLNGEWKLSGSPRPGACIEGDVIEIKADVPGNIELDLMNSGIIDDPFYGQNARRVRDFEYYSWQYERNFNCRNIPAAADLVMEGVDCLARIFINGTLAGETANAFMIHRLPVAHLLRDGENNIVIEILPPLEALHDMDMEAGMLTGYPMTHVMIRFRKPAHSWGWDILPRLPLGGIFRDIRIEEVPCCRIAEDRMQVLRLHNNGTTAEMIYQYKIENGRRECRNMRIVVEGRCGDSVWKHEDSVWGPIGWAFIMADKVKLWNPCGYGEPNVYDINVKVFQNDEIVAENSFRFGIRLIKLTRSGIAGEGAASGFMLEINGRRVRLHGTNHIPADALSARSSKRLPGLLKSMKDMNCNIVRIWGGGNYECDEFYDFCDREGIMVWHDFMMACGAYPRTGEFIKEFTAEAVAAVKRLRHHPSIVIWAGDNECDCTYALMLCDDPANNSITRKVLPEVCSRHDPGRPFVRSSPEYTAAAYARQPEFPETVCADQHLWGVRDYYKSDYYSRSAASLSSEVGYPGCPSVSSLKKFLPETSLWPPENEDWIYHATNVFYPDNHFNDMRIKLLAKHIKMFFGMEAENIEDFALASQICQAEALKTIMEKFRSEPEKTGVMIWNLADGWPLLGEGCIDYYLNKKLAYYYLRRSQQHLMLTLSEAVNWQREIIVVNDTVADVRGRCIVRCAGDGTVVAEKDFSASAGSVTKIPGFADNVSVQKVYLLQWETEAGGKGCNHYLAGMPCFDFCRYRNVWLGAIAALDDSFNAEDIAR